MGYKESNDQWTEHEENYSTLLENLSGQNSELPSEVKVETSLEKKSEGSRARVHYKKFTRGKDLSQYSEKDLANIFGRKSLKEKKKTAQEEEKEQPQVEENPMLVNGGSMTDYFKKKLPGFSKSNGLVVGSNGVLKIERDSDTEERSGFGFGSKSETTTINNGYSFYSKKETFVSYVNGESQPETGSKKRKIDEVDETETPKKKKKKKSKNVEDSGLNNPAFDTLEVKENVRKENKTENDSQTVEEPEENPYEVKVKSKKKKKKNTEDLGVDNPNLETQDTEVPTEVAENPYEVKPKKKKKKGGDIHIENSSSEAQIVEQQAEVPENPYEVKIKKKKKVEDLGVDNPNLETQDAAVQTEVPENPYEVKVKAKKDKKKKKNKDLGIDNPSLNTEDAETSIEAPENPYEVKVKKSKKKREFAIDNPNFNPDASNELETSQENPDETPKKKKKKKDKGKQILEETKENQVVNAMPECDLMLNVVANPIIKTETITKPSNKVKRRKSVRFSDMNEERIIPNNQELQLMSVERNELFDINTKVIENGLEEEARKNGTLNSKFDMQSIDKKTFYEKSKPLKKRKRGVENSAFDEQSTKLQENIDDISKTIDMYQAQIENDINEAKTKINSVELDELMVGEPGISEGDHEKVPEGALLKFHGVKFGKSPAYMNSFTGPKKSYKHLIKGDVIVAFKESNLHEIYGYGVKKPSS